MFISSLTLQNFRNYTKSDFSFDQGTTVIVGPNTIGKTNILEAIFMLACAKSFRAEKDLEMIKFGAEVGRMMGEIGIGNVLTGEEKLKLEIVLTPGKRYLVNGVPKRQIDFMGNLRAVVFEPTDLELVTDSPSLRRKYLDFVLIQVDREYRRALLSYEKGMRQRNRLLERIRDEGLTLGQLHFWNELLVKNGRVLTLKRKEFINYVNHEPQLFGRLQVIYDESEISQERLLKYQNQEIACAQTLVGPHRDDFKFEIRNPLFDRKLAQSKQFENARDISLFGSRGEQRLAILWLKMSELEFVTEKCGERPLLLFDDIFSELDENHRKQIMEVIHKQQTIITTTDLDHVGKDFLGKVKVIELK